jgi:hypothetical protein
MNNAIITDCAIKRTSEAMIAKVGRGYRRFQTYLKEFNISVFYTGELYIGNFYEESK